MRTIELFAGTKSASEVFAAHGHETFTIDNDATLLPDLCADVCKLSSFIAEARDILWASPPCQGFSVAAIGKNWNKDYTPKTQSAEDAMEMVKSTLRIIRTSTPRWWFIENPRGMLRKMPFMDEFLKQTGGVRHTVTYCQYGDTRMKPTDIWTNAWWWNPKPACKNGDKCHESAPRGSRTGTQGIKGAKDRGRIPSALFDEILEQMPK